MSQQGRRKTKRFLDFQARNQLGTSGGEKSFLREGQFLNTSMHFSCADETFSRGGFVPPWLRVCRLLYFTKNKRFLAYFMRILNSFSMCSSVTFDLANQGLRQPVQPHTFNSQLLAFAKTLAQPHFAVINGSDVGMSVFHSPVLMRSLVFLQLQL